MSTGKRQVMKERLEGNRLIPLKEVENKLPSNYMFELNDSESHELRSKITTTNVSAMNRNSTKVFTERGLEKKTAHFAVFCHKIIIFAPQNKQCPDNWTEQESAHL